MKHLSLVLAFSFFASSVSAWEIGIINKNYDDNSYTSMLPGWSIPNLMEHDGLFIRIGDQDIPLPAVGTSVIINDFEPVEVINGQWMIQDQDGGIHNMAHPLLARHEDAELINSYRDGDTLTLNVFSGTGVQQNGAGLHYPAGHVRLLKSLENLAADTVREQLSANLDVYNGDHESLPNPLKDKVDDIY